MDTHEAFIGVDAQIQALKEQFTHLRDDMRQQGMPAVVPDTEALEESLRQLRETCRTAPDIGLREPANILEQRIHKLTTELEDSNRELQALNYSVSHDLRAPLRSIGGFSQALLEDNAEQLDAQGKEYLQRVQAAAQRMTQMIDGLLQLSRLGRAEMRQEQVDLSALAADIAAELRQQDPERQAEFLVTPGITATGDPQLLRVALDHLLGNAWKFTIHCPITSIEFGMMQKGETVYYVRDNGVGFDMGYAEKLFTPFQRMHSEEEFPGIGIGLAIVQRIIRRHGGRIWAESAIDHGATFYFTLGGA